MFGAWLQRWATYAALKERDAAVAEARRLQQQLEEANAKLAIRELQIAELTEVVTRDRERIAAERAAYSRAVAECEGAAEHRATSPAARLDLGAYTNGRH